MGVVYPAYASFKAVEVLRVRNEPTQASRWLTYWAIYGTITAIERAFDKVHPWIPYYTVVKLAFLIWLQIPRFSGASRIATEFIYPVLHKAHPHIDNALVALQHYMSRPEILAAGAAVQEVFSRIPVLEWFVRGPDGKPLPRPKSSSSDRGSFITSE